MPRFICLACRAVLQVADAVITSADASPVVKCPKCGKGFHLSRKQKTPVATQAVALPAAVFPGALPVAAIAIQAPVPAAAAAPTTQQVPSPFNLPHLHLSPVARGGLIVLAALLVVFMLGRFIFSGGSGKRKYTEEGLSKLVLGLTPDQLRSKLGAPDLIESGGSGVIDLSMPRDQSNEGYWMYNDIVVDKYRVYIWIYNGRVDLITY